jgi:DNA-binding transcriptional MerR regulator
MNVEAVTVPLLTSEVARILDVSPETVRLWERLGRLPALKTKHGVRLFDQRDVEQFAREREERRSASDACAPVK